MVRTQSFYCHGLSSIPGQETKILQAVSCDQKNKVIETYMNIDTDGVPWWLSCKESAWNAGEVGLIPGSGRHLGEGNDYYPFQYACLGNPMDRWAWQVIVQGVAKELETTEHDWRTTTNRYSIRQTEEMDKLYLTILMPTNKYRKNSVIRKSPFGSQHHWVNV